MDALIVAAITGVVSSVGTIAAIRVDIGWIKQIQCELKSDIEGLQTRVAELEKS